MNINIIIMILFGYIAGSIPFGYIIARIMGTGDIRMKGSGNIGATNVLRTTGKSGGAMTLLLDALKGAVPVLIAKSLWGVDIWTLAVALAAVVGHNYTVFLKFRGGKGVATSLGVILSLWPYIGLITLCIWIGSMIVWRYSSLSALISFGLLPFVTAIGEQYIMYVIFSVLISSLLYYRHKENIRRLIAGQEGKIGSGGSTAIIIILSILVSSVASMTGSAHASDRLIPLEVEKLWKERQVAVTSGNIKSADLIMDEIIKTKYQLGINRIDDISALIVREGYLSIEKGKPEDAYRLSLAAREISPDYAPSYFLAASSLRGMSNAGIAKVFYEYIGGMKASIRDFHTLFNLTGRLYTIFLFGVSLTFLIFVIAIAFRIFPIFLHTFEELTSGFIRSPFNMIIFLIIVFIPLLFGIAWMALLWVVITWIYLNRNDRVLAVIFIIFFLFLPLFLKYSANYVMEYNNIALRGLIAADRGYGEPALINALKEKEKSEPDNDYISFSIAYLTNKDGRAEESQKYFEKLLISANRNIRINAMNALGNIHFYRGDYDKAITYYKDLIKETPESPVPVYNLSQSYREKLLFAEAEKSYDDAKKLSIHDIDKFTALSAKGSGYRVIEIPVAMSDLWKVALTAPDESKALINAILKATIRIPAERFPFLGISIGIILAILSYIKPRTPMAYYCPACHKIVCGKCTGSKIFDGICRTCKTRSLEGVDASSLKGTKLYFAIPGLWHMNKGHMFTGMILSLLFCTGISGLVSWRTSATFNTAIYFSEWPYIFWILLIILSYILLFFTGIRPVRTGMRVMRYKY